MRSIPTTLLLTSLFLSNSAFAQQDAEPPSPTPPQPAAQQPSPPKVDPEPPVAVPAAAPPATDAQKAGPRPGGGNGLNVTSSPAQLTGTPTPNALGPSEGDEWRFSTHGYFRVPLRIGMAKRPACTDGAVAGTVQAGVACAGADQSQLNFHSPIVPDDQYLDWRYNRQWEKDWAEVFLNYGNSMIVATVGLQAYNVTDASYNNTDAQFGISQAYVTLKPKVAAVPELRFDWKVGAFWNRYGMAGKYDAGKYDTYLFGRTHSMGETLAAEYDVGDFTLKASHGIGTKAEQGTTFPPGFSLINHLHAGASYKKLVDMNVHYLASWAQDARATPAIADGTMRVVGAEARVTAGVAGDLYVGFSHVTSEHAQAVGPGIEVVHSLGGGGVGTANGIIENYLGLCSKCTPGDVGTGSINTLSLQYDYSFGRLARHLATPSVGFWGDGTDLTLSLFGMYNTVTSRDPDADGVKKFKFGADIVYSAFSWFAFGLRADRMMPNSKDSEESFWIASPKLMFRTRFVTHEEITLQYSKYAFGANVKSQAPNLQTPPDQNVFGIKATMWW
jgi:hypothetical protein